jgi:hypothetical protein
MILEPSGKGKDLSGVHFEDYKLTIPQKNHFFNIRIYFPDRVVQRDRLTRVCALLHLTIENMERLCAAGATSFR